MANKPLPKLLSYAFAGAAEQKRMLNSNRFCEDAGLFDKLMVTEAQSKSLDGGFKPGQTITKRELLHANAIDSSTLLQEEVYKTVLEGTEPARCFRDILPVINTKTYSVRVVKGESGTYAPKIAEGARFEQETQEYSKTDITVDKYGTNPVITQEMIDDCLFDIVDLELRKAGARLENALNRKCLLEILTDCTTVTQMSPNGSHLAVSDIARAIAYVEEQNYHPDTLITHPTAQGYLLQDSNLVYVAYAGQDRTLKCGKLPTLLGLKPYNCTVTDADSGAIWDDATAGTSVTGIVMDSQAPTAYIVMRDDLVVDQYDDPLHDLKGIICKMRFGVETIWTSSAIQIYHK